MDQKLEFFDGFERKEAFLDQKNIGSKNHKNLLVFKGVSPWFLSKNGDFLSLVFMQNKSGKRFRKKRSLFRPKNIGSKNHQTLHILKGVSPWSFSKNGDF